MVTRNRGELMKLIDDCSKNKHKISKIKENEIRLLVESIISQRVHKQVIKGLSE